MKEDLLLAVAAESAGDHMVLRVLQAGSAGVGRASIILG